MNLFTTVLLALSVASLGTAVPLDNYGAFASSLSAGPTNVVDSHGGGVGNMPNLQFSRMKQHGDGQNPIFVDGEPVRLAGHAAPKSSSTSKESGVKTVYHNNQLGVSVPCALPRLLNSSRVGTLTPSWLLWYTVLTPPSFDVLELFGAA